MNEPTDKERAAAADAGRLGLLLLLNGTRSARTWRLYRGGELVGTYEPYRNA